MKNYDIFFEYGLCNFCCGKDFPHTENLSAFGSPFDRTLPEPDHRISIRPGHRCPSLLGYGLPSHVVTMPNRVWQSRITNQTTPGRGMPYHCRFAHPTTANQSKRRPPAASRCVAARLRALAASIKSTRLNAQPGLRPTDWQPVACGHKIISASIPKNPADSRLPLCYRRETADPSKRQ